MKKLSAAKLSFSLLLIDHKIPEINGLRIISAARSRRNIPKLPSIMVGELEDINFNAATMREMDFDFIPKPVTPENLAVFIDNRLRRQERDYWAHYLKKAQIQKGEKEACVHVSSSECLT